VSEPTSEPAPYQVVYSEVVRNEVRMLIADAASPEEARTIMAAFKEFDRRLRLYPQFGEPLLDLTHEAGRMWLGTVAPVGMRYAVFEDMRLVMVTIPPRLLPASGS
jgi:hypothetical protein